MVSIFNYFDYQKYLREYYEWRKKQDSYFTYRFMASKIGIDHGFIVKILQGQKHISIKSAHGVSDLLKHTKREREYFELLILFARAKTDVEIKDHFKKLLTYVEVSPLKVEGDKYEFYQKWYYTAVREVINIAGFVEDYEQLAGRLIPPITSAQAKKSVELLENLQLIKKNEKGQYALSGQFITPGSQVRSIAIKEFQKATMLLGVEALKNFPKDEREIATMTLSLSEEGMGKLKESMVNFRSELMRIAHQDTNVTRAYQVNLQLFPLSKDVDDQGKE